MEINPILFVLLILIILYIFIRMFRSATRFTGVNSAKEMVEIDADTLYANKTPNMNFSYSIWVYVDDWNYKFGSEKVILRRSDEMNNSSPSIYLDNNKNSIGVRLQTYSDKDTSTGKPFTCSVSHIPLQKWVHVMISVYNRTLDVYVDGKLSRSCLLPSLPRVDDTKNIVVTPDGGFSGKTAGLQYVDKESEPQDVWGIYSNGYTGNFVDNLFYGINQYRLKISLMSEGTEEGSVEI